MAEEEGGDTAQAGLSRAVSINLGLALDCIMHCWKSLGDSAAYDSVSSSVNRANDSPQHIHLLLRIKRVDLSKSVARPTKSVPRKLCSGCDSNFLPCPLGVLYLEKEHKSVPHFSNL